MAEILSKCDPKSLSPTLYLEKFIVFIQQQFSNYGNPFVPLGGESHFPFKIDFHDLVQYDSALAFNILYHPKLLLPLFDDALNTCISHLYRDTALFGHVRICHLPPVSNVIKASISEIKPSDGDNLIQVCGTVVSTGGIRMLEVSRQFECLNPKCKHQFRVYADSEQDSVMIHPKSCPNLMLDGNRCNSSVLRELENGRICVDFQEIKVQDKVDNLTTGIIPRTITIHLQADLADKCLPGNDVVIVGYVLRKWRYLSKNYRGSIDIVLFANSINFFEEEESYKYSSETNTERFSKFWSHYKPLHEFDGRNIIIKSVCPQLHGMHFAKLSLLLALIGGCTCEATGATEKRRSNIHLLYAGDPGCGKSQLLQFASAVFPRSVLTTGMGTTGAGLTCAATKDEHGCWSLEAGALVLASGGVCCIDEFASIKEHDRSTIHEAMEQQTLSIAKAGMIVKLNTVTTIIASCNFKGQFDASVDFATNIAIGTPLLSRFDIILLLLDKPKKSWDIAVSTHLLQTSLDKSTELLRKTDDVCLEKQWNIEMLREYVHYVRKRLNPIMTNEAKLLLQRYYNTLRQHGESNNFHTTVRVLESLLRISEAHAKLMFREQVEVSDAIVAIICVSSSSPNSNIDQFQADGTNLLDSLNYDTQEAYVYNLLQIKRSTTEH